MLCQAGIRKVAFLQAEQHYADEYGGECDAFTLQVSFLEEYRAENECYHD